MDISSIQTQAQVSVIRKVLDTEGAAAQKLLDSLDEASATINAASQDNSGLGRFIDVRV